MYILYLDESGNPDDAADAHFVLAGAAIYEKQTYFTIQALDQIQAKHFPGLPPIEFHASQIRSGSGFWRKVLEETRAQVLADLVAAIRSIDEPRLVLFAGAVRKTAGLYGERAVLAATEEVCRRFDLMLQRRYRERGDAQRGLLVLAEGRFHQRSRVWVEGFRKSGTQYGTLKNFADIPYFASTKDTRLLQVADLVAHAVYLLYEKRDARLLTGLIERFDQKDGVLHGLVHLAQADRHTCDCPACFSRRSPGQRGPWLADRPVPPA